MLYPFQPVEAALLRARPATVSEREVCSLNILLEVLLPAAVVNCLNELIPLCVGLCRDLWATLRSCGPPFQH